MPNEDAPDLPHLCICPMKDNCRQYSNIEHFINLYRDVIHDYATDLPTFYKGLLREAEDLSTRKVPLAHKQEYDRCASSARESLRQLKDITDHINEMTPIERAMAREHLAVARIALSSMTRILKNH